MRIPFRMGLKYINKETKMRFEVIHKPRRNKTMSAIKREA